MDRAEITSADRWVHVPLAYLYVYLNESGVTTPSTDVVRLDVPPKDMPTRPILRLMSRIKGAREREKGGSGISRETVTHGDVVDFSDRISRELEEIGLTESAPWISGIVLYGIAGTTVLAISAVSPSASSSAVRVLASLSVAMAVFCVWGLKARRHVGWSSHARVSIGITLIVAGCFSDREMAASMGMLLIFPLVSTAYLYRARRAIPYAIVGAALLAATLVIGEAERWYVAQAIVAGMVLVTLTGAVIASQSRLRMLIRLFHDRSITDPLTGAGNARRLRAELESACERAVDDGFRFALFALDLDNFKRVNDEFDHRTGDRVLVAVAKALGETVSEGDLVVRRGGDEFSVLVSAPEDRDLSDLADRLRAAITVARNGVCPQVTPSGSVGYVVAVPGESAELLMQRADDELHVQKRRFHAHRSPVAVRARNGSAITDISLRRAESAAVGAAAREGESGQDGAERRGGLLRAIGQRWFIVAWMSIEVAVLLVVASAAGYTGGMTTARAALFAAAFTAVAGAAYLTGRLRVGEWSLHLVYLAFSALIATAVLVAEDAGSALLDLMVLSALISYFVFAPRLATAWFAANIMAMSAITLTGDFPLAVARLSALIAVAAVMATLFAKLRKLTVKFMQHHVEMSQIDPLTGLANRRLLREQLSERLERAAAAGSGVAVIALDLDEFKPVNDLYSHSMGDRLLCAVAETVRSAAGNDDLVARRGGDEFYLVCGSSGAEDVAATADRIGDAIIKTRLKICPDINPSATVVAVASEPADDADALIYRADLALHDGKRRTHGRRERSRRFSA